jgi:lipopolysaccharide export LptBFGC system permease protein LptF
MYGPRTLERLVDPALADLQVEYDAAVQAGRKWQSRWIWTVGHVAFFKMIAVHGGQRAMEVLSRLTHEERRGLIRTSTFCLSIIVVVTIVFAAPPLLSNSFSRNHGNPGILFIYLIPQALPLSIPIGLTFGIIWGVGTVSVSRRTGALILIAAAAVSIVSFTMLSWFVPASNQAFRVSVIGRHVTKGANELTLGELRQLLEPRTNEAAIIAPPAGTRHLALTYHTRWALAGAPFVLATFALALTSRRQLGRLMLGGLGLAAIFGYYVIMYSGRRLGLDGEVPAVAAAWAPNAALLILSFALVKLRSFQRILPRGPDGVLCL